MLQSVADDNLGRYCLPEPLWPRRAAVIGGLGMIGGAVARYLTEWGVHVHVVDRKPAEHPRVEANLGNPLVSYQQADIRDLQSLCGALAGCDQVYHFAGELGTSEMDADIYGAIHTNVLGTLNVLNACLTAGACSLFNATKPMVWLNTYTVTKTCTEQLCQLFNKNQGERLRVTQLRYFNAYGRDQHFYPVRKIVPTFILQAMHDLPIEVYGDGEQTVDMIYVDDLAALTVQLTCRGYRGPALDCGAGVELTVNEVARDINRFFGREPGRIRHLPMRHGEDPGTRLRANLKPLQQLLDVRLTPWSVGLAATCRWATQLSKDELDRALRFYRWPKSLASHGSPVA